ncbi:adenosylmethionine decarboxylase [Iodobacter fluviatilis]|jgi:S-adenosylmethionine decarboxylase|uniref:Adenosylmethionine decarboxylase n=1 Tax=Iodobacter fluviatilis TaxID=537 RepID=A0A7G3G9H7_9NEIS|nr:adenosylmethionine decarboxylase [Iodobacter fluviatilis]QBC44007.1 adenosylmethionine decarboxylase [Iodobacter fluviatilis]
MSLGRHILADLSGIEPVLLADPVKIEQILRSGAEAGNATVLAGHFHHFGLELGVTGVLLLMESHLSIHTWPEHGYAAVDIFMCGEAEADAALISLIAALSPAWQKINKHERSSSSVV